MAPNLTHTMCERAEKLERDTYAATDDAHVKLAPAFFQ